MLQWYERWPERLEAEAEAYASHGLVFQLNETLLAERRLVVFEGTAHADDGEHRLRVIYPPMFPDVVVLVVDVDRRYPRHQNPKEGNLCLPDWERHWTGAAKVEEAIGLINLLERNDPEAMAEAERPAPEPVSTWYTYTPGCHVLVPEQLTDVAQGSHGEFSLALINQVPDCLLQASLVEVFDIESKTRRNAALGQLGAGHAVEGGCWVRSPEAPRSDLQSFDEWCTLAAALNPKIKYSLEKQAAKRPAANRPISVAFAIIYPEEGPYREYHDQWQICVRWLKPGGGSRDMIFRPHLLPSADTFFLRMPQLQGLRGKQVFVLGLGALGSVLATELARAGLARFVFVDHDGFQPGNVVRHTCDLRAFGLAKIEAVASQILCVNPGSSVAALPLRVGTAPLVPEQYEDQLQLMEEHIGRSDLVVSTIGDPAVERRIDEMARSLGTPGVYAGVFYGAWGGQVFLSEPSGACFDCYDSSDQYGTVPIPQDRPLMYLDGCGDPSFPGAGFDTSVVANLATRLSVQVLLDGQGYPRPTYNLISWSSRGETEGLFPSVRSSRIERRPGCEICGHEEERR